MLNGKENNEVASGTGSYGFDHWKNHNKEVKLDIRISAFLIKKRHIYISDTVTSGWIKVELMC